MSGSIYGKVFQIATWGESHGKALGVVVDGCPAGVALTQEEIQKQLDRRKPGTNPYATKRKESDSIQILSGVFDGKTTGTPISMLVFNEDQKSHDYSEIASYYRPGHADYTFDKKYGFRDYRGGGRTSGRETLSRVAAGAVAKKILESLHIYVTAYTYSIGDIVIDKNYFSKEEMNNVLCMPEQKAAQRAQIYLKQCMKEETSAGGVVECVVTGLPSGIGEPVFDKLDASLGKAIFSIGAVKGVEFGSGFDCTRMSAHENNDSFILDETHRIKKQTNHAGGVLGGISDGSSLILRAAFKPTPSIHKTQKTVTTNGKEIEINIKGRHDPIIVPRAVVVVESMTAITLVDLLFQNMFSKMEHIIKYYQ